MLLVQAAPSFLVPHPPPHTHTEDQPQLLSNSTEDQEWICDHTWPQPFCTGQAQEVGSGLGSAPAARPQAAHSSSDLSLV